MRTGPLRNSVTKSHGLADFYGEYAEALGITIDEASYSDWFHNYYFWLHWGQYSSSTTPADVAELKNIVVAFYELPAVRYSWDHSPFGRPNLDPKFVEWVDRVLSEALRGMPAARSRSESPSKS